MQRNTIFLACFFICVNCFSQQYPFVYYTPKDGLINSRVRNIKQDSKGRMLFTTYGGLSIYDGTRFTNYNQQDGLANELINDIVEITPDSFLVATNTQKLNTLVHGKIGVYQTEDNFYPTINRFFKSQNGNWYAVADEGLFEFKNKKFTRLPFIHSGKDLGTCLDKIAAWKNFFLIIPWNGELPQKMILYNSATGEISDAVTDKKIFDVAIDSKNIVWVTSSKGIKQLDLDDLEKGKIIFKEVSSPYNLLKNTSLFIDAVGNAWFYNDNEIRKISTQFKTQFFSNAEGLKAGNLTCLFQDKEGTMWMATDGNGVIKLKSTNIQLFTSVKSAEPMVVHAIYQQNDTTWIFNEADHSVYRLTGTETKQFSLPQKLSVSRIYSYHDQLFLSNPQEILSISHKNNAESYFHPQVFFKDSSLGIGTGLIDPFGSIISVTKANDERFLLSVLKKTRILMQYNLGALVDQMVFDNQKNIWLATRDDHILEFKLNPLNSSNYLQLVEDFSKGLPLMGARAIAIDNNNGVWIGTRYNGLYHFLLTNHQLKLKDHFTTKNGLTDNFIYTLACDNNNTIWAGTQTGLDKIFIKNNRRIIANIGKNNDNFQIVTRIEIAKDGTVWSLNNDGTFLKISPEASQSNPHTPSFLFTSIKVNNAALSESIKSFSHEQNNFFFTVAAPSFIDEKSIRYSYYLEGSSNHQWSELSNLSAFSFVGLNAGDYTLHVRCEFPESMYPPQEIMYSFIIQRPWWRTWWFITIMIAFSVFLMFLIVRDYYQRKLQKQKNILEKKQAIEKERTRIATDMHDDLGAGLSRIKFLSETIGIKKQQQKPIEEDVIKIREYSHEMIGKMGEIVWALNEKNDSLNDLIAYTRAYAVEYLSENGITCKVELSGNSENYFLSGEFRRNIFLSVKEILHNIVKHAQANNVSVNVEVTEDLKITICDDGIGFFHSEIRPFSNGLFNIEKRMKEIDGTSEITSMRGTTVILRAPLS